MGGGRNLKQPAPMTAGSQSIDESWKSLQLQRTCLPWDQSREESSSEEEVCDRDSADCGLFCICATCTLSHVL